MGAKSTHTHKRPSPICASAAFPSRQKFVVTVHWPAQLTHVELELNPIRSRLKRICEADTHRDNLSLKVTEVQGEVRGKCRWHTKNWSIHTAITVEGIAAEGIPIAAGITSIEATTHALLNGSCFGSARQEQSIWPSIDVNVRRVPSLSWKYLSLLHRLKRKSLFGVLIWGSTNQWNNVVCPGPDEWCKVTQVVYLGSGERSPTSSRGSPTSSKLFIFRLVLSLDLDQWLHWAWKKRREERCSP